MASKKSVTYTISLTPRFQSTVALGSLFSHLLLTCLTLDTGYLSFSGHSMSMYSKHLATLSSNSCCATVCASGCLQGCQVPSFWRRSAEITVSCCNCVRHSHYDFASSHLHWLPSALPRGLLISRLHERSHPSAPPQFSFSIHSTHSLHSPGPSTFSCRLSIL